MTGVRPDTARCDLVIHNARLVAGGLPTPNGMSALAIADGTITAIGSDEAVIGSYRPRRTLDADGAVVHPGFIDAHTHVSQYSSRSAGRLLQRRGRTMGHWKGELTAADEVASVRLAMLDLLSSGYTSFVDPGTIVHVDDVAAAITGYGMRAWVTDPYVADRPHKLEHHVPELVGGRFGRRWPTSLEEAKERVGGQLFRNDDDTTIHAYVGLYGEQTDSTELYKHAADVARTHGVVVQKHLGYRAATYHEATKELGTTPVRWLWREGLLDGLASFVHMNRLEPDETELLAEAGAACVWCPYGQLQAMSYPSASPRHVELHRSGANVGIGSDIARAVNLDGLASLATAASTALGTPMGPDELLWMRTKGAAATVGCANVGDLETGARADLVIRAPHTSQDLRVDPAWETALLGARGAVRTVIVNGVVVFDDGAPLTFDPADAVAAARESAQRMLRRLEAA